MVPDALRLDQPANYGSTVYQGHARFLVLIGEVLQCELEHLVLPEDFFTCLVPCFLHLDSSKTALHSSARAELTHQPSF